MLLGVAVGVPSSGHSPSVSPCSRWAASASSSTLSFTYGFVSLPVWWQIVTLSESAPALAGPVMRSAPVATTAAAAMTAALTRNMRAEFIE